jgi:hypothetical protein
MRETFHIKCDFCHIEFDSWQNAPWQYKEHIEKCLGVDHTVAKTILEKVLPEQFRQWAYEEGEKIKRGEYYG